MDAGRIWPKRLQLNEEWTADRVTRAMWLDYGAAGRAPDELTRCPHCARPYYRSNGGACPRCGGPVLLEPPRDTAMHFGLM
jgi:hypothetical protein